MVGDIDVILQDLISEQMVYDQNILAKLICKPKYDDFPKLT